MRTTDVSFQSNCIFPTTQKFGKNKDILISRLRDSGWRDCKMFDNSFTFKIQMDPNQNLDPGFLAV